MAGFNIDSFKANGLKLGGARPSLFSVQLQFPLAVPSLDGKGIAEQAEFLIKAAALPASTIGEIDVSYFGRKIKMSGDRTFDDWTVTVLNDEDFKIRNGFEAWSNFMNTHQSNRLGVAGGGGSTSPAIYKTDITVTQYSKGGPGNDNGVIRSYVLVGAFPTQISAITLDWDRNNTIEEFDVRFAYDYWRPYFGGTYTTKLDDDARP
jgi:hypothetical protein